MAHYLVTGGAGFIGSNLVAALVAQGHAVRVLDNFSTGRRANLAGCAAQIDVIEGDIRAYHSVLAAVQGVDYVLHQAALPSVPRSVQDPITTNAVNVEGTLHVLHAAQAAGVRRVVMASSSSVYGSNPVLPKQEEMCPQPKSPYAVAKLAAEQYCQVFWQVYGLETVALRYFNVFGPRQDPNSHYAAVIPRFIQAMQAGKPVVIHGDGTQSRDFTYIDNAVQANLLAATAPDVAGHVLNIACGERHTLLALATMLADLLQCEPQIVYEAARTGDVRHSQADISRAQALLKYTPAVDFGEGLRRTVAWYQSAGAASG